MSEGISAIITEGEEGDRLSVEMNDCSIENKEKLTVRQVITIIVLLLSVGAQGLWYSSISSYFPQQALAKGCTTTDVGVILAAFACSSLLFSLAAPNLIKKFGPRKVLLATSSISTISGLPFAFVMQIRPGLPFIASCITIRFFEGISLGGILLPTLNVFTSEYRGYLSLLTGLAQMAFASGTTAGPFIGGAFFDRFGFAAPNLFLVGLSLILTIMIYFSVHPKKISEEEESGEETTRQVLIKLAKIPDFIFPISAYLFTVIGITMLNVSLGPRLAIKFGISSFIIGCYFMVTAGINMVLAPFIGIFNDRKGYHEVVVIIGSFVYACSQLLYGPVPFLHIKTTLNTIIVSLIIMGVSFSMIMVPVTVTAIKVLKFYDISETQAVVNVINSVLVMTMNIGDIFGPFLGGLFIQYLTLQWTCLVFASFSLLVGIIGICVLARRHWCGKRKNYTAINGEHF